MHSPLKSRCNSNPDLTTGQGSTQVTVRKRKQPESDHSHDEIARFASEVRESLKRLEEKIDSKFTNLDKKVSSMQSDLSTLSNNFADMKGEINALSADHRNVVGRVGMIENHLNDAVTSLEQKHTEVVGELSSLQAAIQFQFNQQADILQRTLDLETVTKTIDTSTDLVATLETKIDSLEQHARQCNVEITNVPERKNENILNPNVKNFLIAGDFNLPELKWTENPSCKQTLVCTATVSSDLAQELTRFM
ncbi:unnamed protein product [Arctia plantaginis]|uniref:Uncharacterized protein n=1 Tax=Arctia plantaginis TaxID=874455 RepID=A0A8S0YRI9_ARCPL|nr:unnamed protein product [Arctia plantaginis]